MLLKCLALCIATCTALIYPQNSGWADTPLQHTTPQSVSNLASGLLDAVVNISTSQTLKGTEQGNNTVKPDIQKDAPFQEYFKDFFSSDNNNNNTSQSRKVQSLGSGFVIDAQKGLIVTNNHVIADADDIEVNFTDGSKLKAKLLGKDAKTDLALLQVDPAAKKLTAVEFGDSESARIGDWVMAIGNPFGLGGTVTIGIISARNRDINAGPYDDFIQTDAAINRGNSGGPLQLKEFGETRRGWLAIRIQPVSEDIATIMKLPKAEGALVAGKIEDKTVDHSQIQDGDVIIRFAGHKIKDARELPRIVAESPVGKISDVTVIRDGQEKTVQVKLGLLKEKETDADSKSDPKNSGKDKQEPKQSVQSMGMTLSAMTDELRKTYNIKQGVEGVVVTAVVPKSAADEKRIRSGDVIIDINQEQVKTPEDVAKRLENLRATGRKNALLVVSGAGGELRFVTVRLD